MKRYLSLLVALIVISAILVWNMISATISPQEVQINATLKPIPGTHYMNEEFSGTHFNYKLEIVLDSFLDNPLSTDFSYFHDVYPYVNGNFNGAWEYYDPQTGDVLDKAEGLSIGSHSYTEAKASKKLKEIGVALLEDNKWFVVDGIGYGPKGFSYIKDTFPVGVRFYILKNNDIPNEDRNYVLYTHYETKVGKDVSWTKVFPVELKEE